jgi:hypothetical protein
VDDYGRADCARATDVNAELFRWRVGRGDEQRSIIVAISGTLMAVERDTLSTPIDVIVATRGEAAVRDALSRDRTPERITVNTTGVWETSSE